MLILTLDDAVTVTKQLVADDMDDAEIIKEFKGEDKRPTPKDLFEEAS